MKLRMLRPWTTPGRVSYVVGDIVDVDADVGDWLVRHGGAVDPEAAPERVSTPAPQSPEPDLEPDPVAGDAESPERPKNAANKDLWSAYYQAIKGAAPDSKMSKDDIIAAVG